MRTSADGVYAIGDLVHGPALAHKASDEGIIAVEDAAGLQTHPLSYDDIPAATFCSPQVASFGLTEAEATRARRATWWSASSRWAASARRPSTATARAWSRSSATHATASCSARTSSARARREMIAELVVAKQLEGGYEEIARTVHPHPTFSEAVMEAARATAGWVIHA